MCPLTQTVSEQSQVRGSPFIHIFVAVSLFFTTKPKLFCVCAVLLLPGLLASPIGDSSLDPVAASDKLSDVTRAKRSGFDLFGGIKKHILSGIGQASASLAAGSSGSSSSKSHPAPHEEIKIDAWHLKKSILNTLFQAVKAITGGVTAIKGQLIKGSGYLISAKGKLIAASGDKVTNVGKKIVTNAILVPPNPHPFAKLSGGSSSSQHSSPTGHSESFTSFESPITVEHHHSYDTHSEHAYLPPAPLTTSYGSPSVSPGYVSTKYGAPTTAFDYHSHVNYPPLTTGHSANYIQSKSIQSAADVLRQVLNEKVPSSTDHPPQDNYKLTQYAIPSDPQSYVPQFKPLGPNQAYGPPIGVVQTQTITTAYGNPAALPSVQHNWLTNPKDPYATYAAMTAKNQQSHALPKKSVTVVEDSKPDATDNRVHHQQLKSIKHMIGGADFDIQRSVSYELTDGPRPKRRTILTKRTKW
ncbi:uncharacterized protein LOC132257987 [Phlebotomus argentipes]|uniref:uncharacterized protein LOC132257987 n=1 Tax=Phlebotomus argentipes TaxID=94469 RepID=UPI0028930230|nr:uncharacterized protein LOC132257987 [Phlebotomus argentipes]